MNIDDGYLKINENFIQPIVAMGHKTPDTIFITASNSNWWLVFYQIVNNKSIYLL